MNPKQLGNFLFFEKRDLYFVNFKGAWVICTYTLYIIFVINNYYINFLISSVL